MPDLVTIQLLGGFRLTLGDRELDKLPTRKAAGLLAFLACHSEREHQREELAERFWPDADPEAARKSLSVALTALRHTLRDTPETLEATRLAVRLREGHYQTDAERFERALSEAGSVGSDRSRRIGLLQEATALWKGPLLPGWYDDWIPAEAERLLELVQSAYVQLIADLQAEGRTEEALVAARRAVTLDPLRETSHRRVMELLGDSGRFSEALRHYRDLERLLRRELDLAADAETQALAASLRSRTVPSEAPPVSAPTSSSASLGEFFGREQEVEQLRILLRDPATRLVTVTGPGGIGKTRLAHEVLGVISAEKGRRPTTAQLADLATAAELPRVIAQALTLEPKADRDPVSQIAEALGQKSPVMLMDNLEHLLCEDRSGEVGRFISELLSQAPQATILITSRRPLRLPGEREFPLSPLPTPPEASPVEELELNDSVRLFCDRARAVRPDFRLNEANAADIREVCRRLDGIPLALELAAARYRVLSPKQMVVQLESGLGMLARPGAAASDRHRSLEATLEWSYSLLSEANRAAFRALSLFRGGASLEAATAVLTQCGEAPEALELLSQLLESSLLLAEEVTGEMRYRMLEPVRQYARGLLTPEERDRFARRHRDFFLPLLEEIFNWPHSLGATDRLALERANILGSLQWSVVTPGEGLAAMRIAGAMGPFWGGGREADEGLRTLMELLARPELKPPTLERARALAAAGSLLHSDARVAEAVACYEEAAEIARSLGNTTALSHPLSALASIACSRGDLEAGIALLEESLELKLREPRIVGIPPVLMRLGQLSVLRGDLHTARRRHEHALRWATEHGDHGCALFARVYLGALTREEGDPAEAVRLLTEIAGLWRERQAPWALGDALRQLGIAEASKGDRSAAREHLREALALVKDTGSEASIAEAAGSLGRFLVEEGEIAEGSALLRQSLTKRARLHRNLEITPAVQALARAAAVTGDLDRAARLAAIAEALRGRFYIVPPTEERQDRAATEMCLNSALSAARRAEIVRGFDGLSPEDLIEQALRLEDCVSAL